MWKPNSEKGAHLYTFLVMSRTLSYRISNWFEQTQTNSNIWIYWQSSSSTLFLASNKWTLNIVQPITLHFTDDVIVTTFRFTYWLFVNFALKNFSSLDSKWCMRTLTWQRRNLGKCSTTLFTTKCGKNTTVPKPSLTSMKKSTKKRVLENKHKSKISCLFKISWPKWIIPFVTSFLRSWYTPWNLK